MDSCVRRISWNLVGFLVRWYSFRSVSSDLWCYRWRWLLLWSVRQALLGSSDGGARMAPRLRLTLVFIVVARWSNDLFVIFVMFGSLCTDVDDYQ
jgi:hypothetical protein